MTPEDCEVRLKHASAILDRGMENIERTGEGLRLGAALKEVISVLRDLAPHVPSP